MPMIHTLNPKNKKHQEQRKLWLPTAKNQVEGKEPTL